MITLIFGTTDTDHQYLTNGQQNPDQNHMGKWYQKQTLGSGCLDIVLNRTLTHLEYRGIDNIVNIFVSYSTQ